MQIKRSTSREFCFHETLEGNNERARKQLSVKQDGRLTTLRMRGSIDMKSFSMLLFRITSVMTLRRTKGERISEPQGRFPSKGVKEGEGGARTRGGREPSAAWAPRGGGAGKSSLLTRPVRRRRGSARPPPAAASATSPTSPPLRLPHLMLAGRNDLTKSNPVLRRTEQVRRPQFDRSRCFGLVSLGLSFGKI